MVAVAEDKAGKAHHEIKFILKRRRELTSENNLTQQLSELRPIILL
jgi:hypothetical protein